MSESNDKDNAPISDHGLEGVAAGNNWRSIPHLPGEAPSFFVDGNGHPYLDFRSHATNLTFNHPVAPLVMQPVPPMQPMPQPPMAGFAPQQPQYGFGAAPMFNAAW